PAALVLSACNLLGPRYTRPDIPVPPGRVVDTTQTSGEAQATAVANEAIAIGRTGAPAKPASALAAGPVVAQPKIVVAWPYAKWWRGFGSSQLDDLMAQAQGANDDIAAAIGRVRQADAQVQISGAPLLPALGVGAGAARERQRPLAAVSASRYL